MNAVTALINVMGRMAILLMQQSFIVMMALGKTLGSLIGAPLARRQVHPRREVRLPKRRRPS